MTLRPPLKILLAGLLLWMGAGLAQAADVKISSGEHEDFSRLVLRFPERVDWQFGRVAGGYEFRTQGADLKYLLESVFRLIPRDRIKDLQDLGNGRLFLAVDCACHGDAFDLRGGEVALDIKDGPPLAAARTFNQNLPELSGPAEEGSPAAIAQNRANASAASVLSLETAQIPTFPTGENLETGLPEPTNSREARQGLPLFLPISEPPNQAEANADLPLSEHQGQLEDSSVAETAPSPMGEENTLTDMLPSQRVAETETALLEQIGRAAAQGLLAPNIQETQDHVQEANALFDAETPMAPTKNDASDLEPDQPSGPEAHVAIQTAIDRENRNSTMLNSTENGQDCPPDYLFDVAHWGVDSGNIAQIGAYRTGVLGEFDSINPEAILALARHYLYLTFGAETRALINQFEPDIERRDILLILAEIMDNKHSARGRMLERYLTCPGKVTLWAALSIEAFKPGTEINTQALTAAFSELPLHLRRYLGPPLAGRLITAGETQTATNLRSAIERAGGDHGPGVAYLDAQMAIDRENTDQALVALENAVSSDADVAPNAVLNLIEYKIEHDLSITDREIANAATHAFENRGSEMGQALAQAEIVALAQSARFADAFLQLAVLEGRNETTLDEQIKTRAFVINKLTEDASDAVFLRHAIAHSPDPRLPSDTSFQMAFRLAELGFYQEARAALGQSAQIPNQDERRLYARIALAEGKFDVAMGYLSGLEEVDDFELRAQALDGAQDLPGAAQMFDRAGNQSKEFSAAWRAGSWAEVAELDQGAASQAGQLMINQAMAQESPEAGEISLQTDAALITQAEETRDIVSRLLSEFTIPE